MTSPVYLIAVVGLGGGVGWAAGCLLHRDPRDLLLPDVLQGVCGGILCLEVYVATGQHAPGPVEAVGASLIGALVSVGVSHATAAVLRRFGGGPHIDLPNS
jgi:hypothetical protein